MGRHCFLTLKMRWHWDYFGTKHFSVSVYAYKHPQRGQLSFSIWNSNFDCKIMLICWVTLPTWFICAYYSLIQAETLLILVNWSELASAAPARRILDTCWMFVLWWHRRLCWRTGGVVAGVSLLIVSLLFTCCAGLWQELRGHSAAQVMASQSTSKG